MAAGSTRAEPLYVCLDLDDAVELDRALASVADAVRSGAATVLVLDVGDARSDALDANNGAVFASWHHRHSATLREGVDAIAYVTSGFFSYAYLSMFCFGLNPAFEHAVFRSRNRAMAWARSMILDEK